MPKRANLRLLRRSSLLGLALMDRLDSCCVPEFDVTWQGHGGFTELTALRVLVSSKNHAAKAGIFTQDTVYSPSNDPADVLADIQAKISTAVRRERGIPEV